MVKTLESRRPRLPLSQMERTGREADKYRIGLRGFMWAGLSLFLILLTVFLILLIDGRAVVHAAPKSSPWSSALEAGDWEAVRKAARAAVDRNPRDPEAQNALGTALMELGQLEEAEVPLITAESLAPAVTDYKVSLADLYSRRSVPALAAGKLKDALDLDPSLVDLHWRLARVLFALGDYDESLRELRIINRLQPDNWDAYRLTADVAMGRKVDGREAGNQKFEEAIRNLRLYTAVVPDARAWAKLSFAHMSLNPPDTAEARRAAETALSINPLDTQAHLALARISLIQNRTAEALTHYTEVAPFMLSPRDASFAAKIHARSKNLAGAEAALRTASAIDSTNKDYLYDLGSNLMTQQKTEDTRDVFKQVIKLDPGNPAAYVNWGTAELQLGDPDKAEEAFTKALEANDCFPPAHKGMGDVHVARGASTLAIGSYRRALDCNPAPQTGSAAAGALGYVLWQQGDYSGALAPLKKALEYDSCNLQAILTLANCLQKLGQNAEAVAVLRKGQGCDPGNSQIREALRSLGQ